MHRNGSDSTKLFKKADLILVLVLILGAALCFSLIKIWEKPGKTVRVTIEGKVFGVYPLDQDAEISIEDGNLLEIREGKAVMTWADCPDKICVNHKPISRRGETIVCLPNKLIVEVLSEGEEEEPYDVIAQ